MLATHLTDWCNICVSWCCCCSVDGVWCSNNKAWTGELPHSNAAVSDWQSERGRKYGLSDSCHGLRGVWLLFVDSVSKLLHLPI